MKCKSFSSTLAADLERDVNRWLKDLRDDDGSAQIFYVVQSESWQNDKFPHITLTIFYN